MDFTDITLEIPGGALGPDQFHPVREISPSETSQKQYADNLFRHNPMPANAPKSTLDAPSHQAYNTLDYAAPDPVIASVPLGRSTGGRLFAVDERDPKRGGSNQNWRIAMVINALAATEPGGMLKPFEFAPAALGPMDVEIEVICCGVCASDLHMLKNDWGMTAYPFVPGHEVIGTVRAVGEAVTTIFTGMRVGVGWQSGACMECEWCKVGEHELCRGQMGTCVQRHGGFADRLRVDSRFAIPIPDGLDSPHAAPLLCAGITAFSPFIHYNVRPTMRVGVIGVGGLGHLGLQFARAFGCEVWALSSTADKEQDAERFGAEHFVVSSDEEAVKALTGRLDFILSAVSADLDWPTYVRMLRPKGTLCFVGVPKCDLRVTAFALIDGRKSIVGSPIGSPAMQTKMLKFAARRGVKPMVEAMPMAEANAAFERLHRNQARYRIVLTT